MWGMRNLPMMMGAKRMMSKTTKKIIVGSCMKGFAMSSVIIFRVQKYKNCSV